MTEFIEICGKYRPNERKIKKIIIRIERILELRNVPSLGATLTFEAECNNLSKNSLETLWLTEEEYERIKKILCRQYEKENV